MLSLVQTRKKYSLLSSPILYYRYIRHKIYPSGKKKLPDRYVHIPLKAPRSLYSSPGYNMSIKLDNKCSLHHCRPLLQKKLGRGSPFNVSYQNCCKENIYVNDSQNLAFPTSHFVIELLPFEYLSNQKQ